MSLCLCTWCQNTTRKSSKKRTSESHLWHWNSQRSRVCSAVKLALIAGILREPSEHTSPHGIPAIVKVTDWEQVAFTSARRQCSITHTQHGLFGFSSPPTPISTTVQKEVLSIWSQFGRENQEKGIDKLADRKTDTRQWINGVNITCIYSFMPTDKCAQYFILFMRAPSVAIVILQDDAVQRWHARQQTWASQ